MDENQKPYKTKEYYRQKMRESRARGKGVNPPTCYYITIDGNQYVFTKKQMNKIKKNLINNLPNAKVLF